jgi:hypothetical protein
LGIGLDIELHMFLSNLNLLLLHFLTLNGLIRVAARLAGRILPLSRLGLHCKQGFIREEFETTSLRHKQVIQVVHIALNLSNYMQLVVLDFSVQALLMGEELDSEGLVEYLEGVV